MLRLSRSQWACQLSKFMIEHLEKDWTCVACLGGIGSRKSLNENTGEQLRLAKLHLSKPHEFWKRQIGPEWRWYMRYILNVHKVFRLKYFFCNVSY